MHVSSLETQIMAYATNSNPISHQYEKFIITTSSQNCCWAVKHHVAAQPLANGP
jgi:hypothetical protein